MEKVGFSGSVVSKTSATSLVETVIGVQALKESKEWSVNDIQEALSEQSLTAAVMQRYHVNNAVKRELGSKLGRVRREG